jgi:uncharacterized protein with HEPN domain
MDRKAAKELLHVQGWLERVDEIIQRGQDAYMAEDLLQEAGDSLMMKLGEAANRISRRDVLAPEGVEWALAVANRNFIIHQYDEIDRDLTWLTLSRDLPAWRASLEPLFAEAAATIL